jgi:hypothetical protein
MLPCEVARSKVLEFLLAKNFGVRSLDLTADAISRNWDFTANQSSVEKNSDGLGQSLIQ